MDVAFGSAGGEQRAAADGARAPRHQPLTGPEPLDQGLVPEPAQDADLAPRDLRGTYMGMITLSFASALMVGAPLGGLVLARFGAGALWGGSCAVALAGAVLYAVVSPAVRRAHAAQTAGNGSAA